VSPDPHPTRWTRVTVLGDAHTLAMALLLVALTAGTLLPRLGRQGPAFPIPERTEVGLSESLRPAAGVPPAIASRSDLSPPAILDLNLSDAQALQALPGVGPVLAERIVAYRAAHGPFRAPEELLQVPGIGPQRWGRIRDLVRVGEGA
jgi:competence protein ComEA